MNIDRIVNFQIKLYELKKAEINRMVKSTENGDQNLNTLLDKEVEQKEQVKNSCYDKRTNVHRGIKKGTPLA